MTKTAEKRAAVVTLGQLSRVEPCLYKLSMYSQTLFKPSLLYIID